MSGAQMSAVSLSKEGRESDAALLPGASSALNVLRSVLVTFLYLRTLLFLANSCVSYKIKLLRKLTDLRNQCFSSLTKKGKY